MRTEVAEAAGVAPGMRLECHGISFRYDADTVQTAALTEVEVIVEAGASVAVLGASGSGKSTLLQVIRGLDIPYAGAVVLDAVEPGAAGYSQRQRETGLVFQNAEVQLFAATAWEDVAFGPRSLHWGADDVRSTVTWALDLVGLPEPEYGSRHPYGLSGGEARRLALAGVLAMRPRLLLLDEPFVGLDPAGRRSLIDVFERLRAAGVTMVLVTHDIDLAWRLCDHRLVLAEGRVVADGPWRFAGSDALMLTSNRLREPLLVELWRRLGRPPEEAPRTIEDAAKALA